MITSFDFIQQNYPVTGYVIFFPILQTELHENKPLSSE